jgi:hypothetical protein
MKRPLFLLGFIVAVFLFVALLILPEYRLRVGVVTIIYVVVFAVILRFTMGGYFKNAYKIIFCRRTRYIVAWAVPFAAVIVISFLVLGSGFFSRIKADVSRDKLLSLSEEAERFLSKLDDGVELIYVRPLTGDDERNLFNSIAGEFNNYTDKISFRSLHPVINSADYNDVKKKLPTLSPGSAVAISKGRAAVADKIDEQSLVSAIYRARAGEQGVCVSKGHGEPLVDDFGEKGSAILFSILQDRGITLVPADSDQIDYCRVFIVFEPKSELGQNEIQHIKDYAGQLMVIGGTGLASVRELLAAKGISISTKVEADFSRGALREYDGGIMVDKFSNHPVVSTIKGSVVVASADKIECTKCGLLAAASSSNSTAVPVLVLAEKLLLFSGTGLIILLPGR